MPDLQSIDHINHTINPILIGNEYVDHDMLNENQQIIKNQYKKFNDLGKNLFTDIELSYKKILAQELIEYINSNYVSIIDIDETTISTNRLIEISELVYKFICVDCYNVIIPNYLNQTNCFDLNQFDIYFKNNLNNDISNFKTSFLKTINTIIGEFTALEKLDSSVRSDENYKEILKRYGFYMELINYGDSYNFLFNYFRPVFLKNKDDIIWRIK